MPIPLRMRNMTFLHNDVDWIFFSDFSIRSVDGIWFLLTSLLSEGRFFDSELCRDMRVMSVALSVFLMGGVWTIQFISLIT